MLFNLNSLVEFVNSYIPPTLAFSYRHFYYKGIYVSLHGYSEGALSPYLEEILNREMSDIIDYLNIDRYSPILGKDAYDKISKITTEVTGHVPTYIINYDWSPLSRMRVDIPELLDAIIKVTEESPLGYFKYDSDSEIVEIDDTVYTMLHL